MTDIVERLSVAWEKQPGAAMTKINRILVERKDAIAEITRLRQLLSDAEKRERGARPGWAFAEGDLVRKKSGSWWEGCVVGTYKTEQTPRGYAVQLDKPFGPVQIYPESALESALQSEER